MGVIQKQLTSTSGFRSPGFSVDGTGSFTIANLNTTSNIKIAGETVITPTSLGTGVVSSNLTSLGTLTALTVNSSSDINLTTLTSLNLTSLATSINSTSLTMTTTGAIVLNSSITGSANNMTIGLNTPAQAKFTTLTATEGIFIGSQNVKALSAAFAVALS